MEFVISGKQIKLTDAIKTTIKEKLSKLDRQVSEDAQVKVTVSAKKDMQSIEVTINQVNMPLIRAEEMQSDLYVAIDMVCDKLQTQLKRYKGKLRDKHQESQSIRFDSSSMNSDFEDGYDDTSEEIIFERKKKFNLKPMSAEEAVLQMELVGHDFYIFRNQEDFEIDIVYKRKNGGYGIIEHE